MRIDHEPGTSDKGTPPAYWPSSGSLRVEKLSARYSDGNTTSPIKSNGQPEFKFLRRLSRDS